MNAVKPLRILLATFTSALLLAVPARAAAPEPGWAIHSLAIPSHFAAADNAECLSSLHNANHVCDGYQITATNAGSKPTSGPVTLTDSLPAGLEAQRIDFTLTQPGELEASGQTLPASDCSLATVKCQLPSGALAPDATLEMDIYLTVEAGASEGETLTNLATVEGGHAPTASAESRNLLSATPPPFGSVLSNLIAGPDGIVDTQASSHPYELTTRIDFATDLRTSAQGTFLSTSVEDPRDIAVDLPLGFLGTALATPTCTLAQLSVSIFHGVGGCPVDTIVGHILSQPSSSASVGGPIYNMVPEGGVAAEFGFLDALGGAHLLYAGVAPTSQGYVLRTTAPEITQISLTDVVTNFYGDPAERNGGAEGGEEEIPASPNPGVCDGRPLVTRVHMDSWQNPGRFLPDGEPDLSDPAWATSTSESPPVTGCNQLHFKPTLEAKPETNRADSPTGLDVDLKVPQTEGTETLATPPLKKAVVTLPEGMSVNPSSANGLQGCSLAGIGVSASGQPNGESIHCPDAAKIGTVELETPDLPGVLEGQIYVAKQGENPFNSLLAIYIAVNDPRTGVVVKLPGEVSANPETGQLTTTVDNSPQFPFSELRTHFFGGQRAALRTPAVCGTYKVTSQLTPWSAPESGPPATPSSSFQITQAADGGECPESAAGEPNHPAFSAGTLDPLAATYSPFVLRLSREDGSQELKGLDVALPEGLLGKLAGVAECPEADIALARSREREGGGQEEQASPSCPASSELGTVTVGAGAGLNPYYATGHAYLAGPYKGAPLSLVVITPAVAGPYDLGTVVVRAALQVDPYTAQVTAASDEIPHILDGIPLDVRSIALNVSRHEFTLNPTSCEKMAIGGAITTVLGQSAALQNPFQVGGCKALKFKPTLKLSLKGKTGRTGHPALKAVLTYPKHGAYANIAFAQVGLPHSEFLDQGNLSNVCTQPQLASNSCPASSVYGRARAWSPLLEKPLEGNVYLGVGFGHKLPDLVAELNGQIRVLLHGKVDTDKADGIRNTFEVVPDAPVERFVLEMKGGKKYGLLSNSENVCAKPQRASARFIAQNGIVDSFRSLIANGCKGKKAGKKGGKGRRGHRHGRG